MDILKCKICGGSLKITPGKSIAECEYCGTKQTIPKLDNDQKTNLYERANQYRLNNEYDKAMALYEQILQEDITDAETYWSIVLCKYGIEYVEDPATGKWTPTIRRLQYTPVVSDPDYKAAIQYADDDQKQLYEAEAKTIDNIQKDILAIADKEDPYDIFICYKENDEKGQRTPDSVYANDLYYMLTDEGYKVFFSRITLEDKLGKAYEPYIFNAMNSAKLMLVIGTKPEYFNAVWVKNEWSRFIKLMDKDRTKMLIPCYRDMDPYDLPEEFAYLQSQDMSRLGFSQDLLRGIKKILDPSIPNETIFINDQSAKDQKTVDLSVKKLFLALEEKDWGKANSYCEQILDIDPENAQAYLGKLMMELKVPDPVSLQNCPTVFEDNLNYKRALRYADADLKAKLEEYNSKVKYRNQNSGMEEIYQRSCSRIKTASTEDEWASLATEFDSISGYKDADWLKQKCLDSIDMIRVNNLYSSARLLQKSNKKKDLEEAVKVYRKIANKKNVNEEIDACHRKIREIDEQEKTEAKKKKTRTFFLTSTWGVLGVVLELISVVIILLGGKDVGTVIGITGALVLGIGSLSYWFAQSGIIGLLIEVGTSAISILIGYLMNIETNEYTTVLEGAGFIGLISVVLGFILYWTDKNPNNSNTENSKDGTAKNNQNAGNANKTNYQNANMQKTMVPENIYVKTPLSSNNLVGKNYIWTKNMFASNGFKNIICVEKKDVILGLFTSEGEVEQVTVNGNTSFRKGKKYKPDMPVVITYHSKR